MDSQPTRKQPGSSPAAATPGGWLAQPRRAQAGRRPAGTAPASCAEVVLVAARPLLASAVSPPFRGETATSSTPAAPENRQD